MNNWPQCLLLVYAAYRFLQCRSRLMQSTQAGFIYFIFTKLRHKGRITATACSKYCLDMFILVREETPEYSEKDPRSSTTGIQLTWNITPELISVVRGTACYPCFTQKKNYLRCFKREKSYLKTSLYTLK